jgi:DNA mismatch repair protein MutS
MTFHSILFEGPGYGSKVVRLEPPAFFGDLNLNQLIDSITADWKDYSLETLFYAQLSDLDAIAYRQSVMKDLENKALMQAVQLFSGQMRAMRERLDRTKKSYHKYAIQRSFMGAVEIYCEAVFRLALAIRKTGAKSRGFLALCDYLAEYVALPSFHELTTEMERLKTEFSAIRYCLLLKGDTITVRMPDTESDYSASVEETFAKFSHHGEQNYRVSVRGTEGDNHIQAQIMEGVARLYPATFDGLEAFCADHKGYLDEIIARFDREIQFYLAFLAYAEKLRGAGLSFCLPQLSQTSKELSALDAFDLVLARKLVDERAAVVCNDFFLAGSERIFVVSGPNHGGKTTFARMFGQMHYLASLGLLVPGREVRLFLFDQLFSHFEREENVASLRGKLQDDLIRVRQILDEATPNSLVIMNEIFSSTTLQDAIYLSKQILARLSALDLLGVCVTFLDELASFNEKTVSIVSTVDPDDPAVRTYKLQRRPADGLAYAMAIAQKYRVTYESLRERIKA